MSFFSAALVAHGDWSTAVLPINLTLITGFCLSLNFTCPHFKDGKMNDCEPSSSLTTRIMLFSPIVLCFLLLQQVNNLDLYQGRDVLLNILWCETKMTYYYVALKMTNLWTSVHNIFISLVNAWCSLILYICIYIHIYKASF